MKQQPRVCDARICIRLSRQLMEVINQECDKNGSKLSTFVREALVESLSSLVMSR